MGDGSRDPDRGGAGRDAPAAGHVLLGGPIARQGPAIRASVAGVAVAEGARVGRGKAVRAGRRTLCAGQKRGAQSQGASHPPLRDQLLLRIGAARKDAGRAAKFVTLKLPPEGVQVTRQSFTFHLEKEQLQQAELRDGHYLLRSNLVAEDPAVLWERYIQLTQIEAAFRTMKSELGIRPIYHQLEHRVEAHILVAFLAYCLIVTLKNRLQALAPGLTPKAVLEKLAAIQMLDVWLPTTDGRWLVMPRYTQPETEQAILLHKLQLHLPQQPPPRIKLQPPSRSRAAAQSVVPTF